MADVNSQMLICILFRLSREKTEVKRYTKTVCSEFEKLRSEL